MRKCFFRIATYLLLLPLVGVLLAIGVTRGLAFVEDQEFTERLRSVLPQEEKLPLVTEALPKESYGLLLCGIDHTRTLADVILYARFDLVENRLWILQIPRDLYVDPNSETGKINGACRPFAAADPTAKIADIIEDQLGLEVDGAAAITLAGVRALVDAVGGVPVTLAQPLDYLPGQTLPAGEQVIGGEQAEWLLRHRSGYTMGDLDRLKVQKQFLFSAMEKTQSIGKLEALSIAAQNMGHVKTTVPFSEIASLLERSLLLTPEQVSIEQIPTYGAEYKGLSVLCANRFRLAETLNASVRAFDPIDPWELCLFYPPEVAQNSQSSAPTVPTPDFDFSWNFPDELEGEMIE